MITKDSQSYRMMALVAMSGECSENAMMFLMPQESYRIKIIQNLLTLRSKIFKGADFCSAVPPSTLKNIINGGSKNAGIVTLKKMCDGLEISLYDFFNTETFKTLEQEIK